MHIPSSFEKQNQKQPSVLSESPALGMQFSPTCTLIPGLRLVLTILMDSTPLRTLRVGWGRAVVGRAGSGHSCAHRSTKYLPSSLVSSVWRLGSACRPELPVGWAGVCGREGRGASGGSLVGDVLMLWPQGEAWSRGSLEDMRVGRRGVQGWGMTEGHFPHTCFCARHPSHILSFNPPRTLGAGIINPICWKGSTCKDLGYLSVVTQLVSSRTGFRASSPCLHSLGILKEVWANHPRLSIFSSDCFA